MDNPIWNSEVEVLQSIYGNECVKQQSNNSIIIKLFLAQGLVELGVEVDQFYPVAIPKYNVKTYWPVAAADHGGFCQLEYSALKTINEKFLEIHSTACGEVIIFEWVEFLSKHLEAISPNQADTSDCVIIEAACSEEDNEVLNTRINDSSSYTKHTKKKPKSKLKSKKANNRPVAAFSTVNVKKAEEVLEEPKKSDKQIADVDLNLLLESDNVNNVVLVKEDFDRIALHKIDDEFKKELEKKKKLGADLVKLKISDKVEFSIIELIREQFKSNWSSVRPVDLNLLKDSFNTAPNSNQTNLFKTLNLNYLRFEKVGFTRDVIENIMWESWGTSFSDSLDWALIFLSPNLLPPSFSDKYLHENSKNSFNFVSKKFSQTNLRCSTPTGITTFQMARTDNKESPPCELLDMKSWIISSINRMESENENDDSVNLQYAKLKIEEDNLKIKGGKNGRKLKQLKEKLELLTSNKDFNVKVANEEFQKLTKPFIDRTKKKSKRPEWEIEVKEKDEIEMGDFFEKEEANVSMTLQPSKCKTVVIKNFAIASSWTGKSPKQFLTDWLSKNAKGCKLAFSSLPTNAGHRIKAYLKGNIKDFENKVAIMEESEIVMTLKEAENYASTKLLYLLLPNLPIYRNLPPPFRELWLDLVKVDENLEIDEKEKLNSQRLSFLTKLYNFIQPKIQDKLKLSQNFGSNKENFEHVEREYSKKGGKLERRNEKFNSTFANCKSIFEMNKLNRFYKQLLFKRQTLPVFSQREKIIKACSENTFVIISGETGSGKSTQVPQFLLENSFEILKEANLICTQPRRISAISIASRVSEEMGEREIGMDKSLIGYSIRLESKISETTRLTFCTTGILLRRMEIDPYLEKITHVIVDEVHERSLESDFLLLLLKKLVKVRNDLTVVLMSATADSQKFYEYFFDAHTPCICVDVPGRTFPVTTMYLEDAIQDTSYLLEEYSEYAVYDNRKISTAKLNVTSKGGKSIQTTVQWSGSDSDDKDDFFASDDFSSNKYNINTINTLKRIDISKINLELIERLIFKLHVEGPVDMNGDRGSILVFLPGYGEIKRLYDVIASNADRNNMTVLPLHSSLNSNQQALVFKPSHSGFRKVILSTNIAETGVTIPDVTYVIDTVKSREVSYDIKRHVTKLSEVFISKANCLQRRGRAGRVREGICYHLVPSKFFFMSLLPQRQPEIMRLPLEELCLRIRAIGYKLPFSQFLSDALDIPPLENVARSVDELMSVGAMDELENLTPLGTLLVNFPVNVRLGKMLLYGVALSCLDPILTITSSLSLGRTPFSRPFGKEQEADAAKEKFKSGDSDLLSLLKCFNFWKNESLKSPSVAANRKFCEENFLSYQNLISIEETKDQLLKLLISINVISKDILQIAKNGGTNVSHFLDKHNLHSAKEPIILAAISFGLYPNVLKKIPSETDRKLHAPTFILQPLAAANTVSVYPNKQSSLFSDGIFEKDASFFTYYSMSRVNSKNTSKLKVWDLNRIGAACLISSSKDIVVEHRQGIITAADGNIQIVCPPRTASTISIFSKMIQDFFNNKIIVKDVQLSHLYENVLEMFINLLLDEAFKMNKIVLIGGGIISACTAHYLQELDPKLQLVIIEKVNIASQASGKAGGFLSRVMCSSSTALKKLSQKSFDLHSDLAEKFNGEVNYDYRRVCVSTRDYVEKDHLTFKKINDTKIGDVNNSAQLNPSSFTNYLVRQNKQLTVKIGDFLDLVKINGKITGIKYQQEDKILFEECDKVVFCTGPWTNQIFDKIGLECPVTIVPHCAESIVVKSDHSSKEMLFIEVCKGNEVRSLEVYPRPNSTIYLCGDGQPFGIEEDIPRPLLDPTEVQPNTSFLNEILKLAKMVELGLEEKSVFKMQACFVPYSHSGAPYIGETHVENVYLAAGHGCWGILNAPATGLALSELIVHGASKLLNSFGM